MIELSRADGTKSIIVVSRENEVTRRLIARREEGMLKGLFFPPHFLLLLLLMLEVESREQRTHFLLRTDFDGCQNERAFARGKGSNIVNETADVFTSAIMMT